MAVRAAHFAFVNLSLYTRPCAPASGICGDIGNLVADVIELENDDVSFAAIHARVLSQVADDLLGHLRAPLRDVFVDSSPLALPVCLVVPRVRPSKALPTPRLQLRLAAPDRRKRFEWLQLAAFRARSHERERADQSTPREWHQRSVPEYQACDPGANRTLANSFEGCCSIR